jgi:hypothetical protein
LSSVQGGDTVEVAHSGARPPGGRTAFRDLNLGARTTSGNAHFYPLR